MQKKKKRRERRKNLFEYGMDVSCVGFGVNMRETNQPFFFLPLLTEENCCWNFAVCWGFFDWELWQRLKRPQFCISIGVHSLSSNQQVILKKAFEWQSKVKGKAAKVRLKPLKWLNLARHIAMLSLLSNAVRNGNAASSRQIISSLSNPELKKLSCPRPDPQRFFFPIPIPAPQGTEIPTPP